MNYHTGALVEIGDYIQFGSDMDGVVVVIIEDSKYSEAYPKLEWHYLECGFLVLSNQAGLIHFPQLSENIKLISKKLIEIL